MPDDDTLIGRNEVDDRNQARREYQRAGSYDAEMWGPPRDEEWARDHQSSICDCDGLCTCEEAGDPLYFFNAEHLEQSGVTLDVGGIDVPDSGCAVDLRDEDL